MWNVHERKSEDERKKEKVEKKNLAPDSVCCVVVLTVCSVKDSLISVHAKSVDSWSFFYSFKKKSNESQQAFQSWCEFSGSESSLRHLFIVNFVTNTCSYCCSSDDPKSPVPLIGKEFRLQTGGNVIYYRLCTISDILGGSVELVCTSECPL